MDITQVAKEIRAILKANFPSIKFSVKSSRFSQGSSVDTSWIDGPTTAQVDELIGEYGDSRSRFIGTSRTHSRELVTQAIALWKKQNPVYAHLTVTCKGETSCHTEFNLDEFYHGRQWRQDCENSLNALIYGSAFDGANLILSQENADDCEPETVNTSEPELAEFVAEAAPQPQELATLTDEQRTELVALQELLISKVEEVNQLKLKIAELQVAVDTAKYNQRQSATVLVAITPELKALKSVKEASEQFSTSELNQLTHIQVGKNLFSIERKKEYQTDAGQPSWLCKLISGNITYDRCVLKVCSVTEFNLVGETIEDLRATTKDVWVLIVRTNPGVLKGRFAWVDNQWKLTEPA